MNIESKSGSEAEGYWSSKARERNCYCGNRNTNPDYFQERGIPDGYCGICETCGKPGHLRHAPNGPYTSAWCDKCYEPGKITSFIASFGLSSIVVIFLAAISKENLIFAWGGVGLVTIILIASWVFVRNFAKIYKMIFSALIHRNIAETREIYKGLDVASPLLLSAFSYLPPPICYIVFRLIFPG